MQEGGFRAAFGFLGERRVEKEKNANIFFDDLPRMRRLRMNGNWIQWLWIFVGSNELAASFSADIMQKFYLNFLSFSLLYCSGAAGKFCWAKKSFLLVLAEKGFDGKTKISLRSASYSYRDWEEILSVNKLLRSHRHINNTECKPLKVASCSYFWAEKGFSETEVRVNFEERKQYWIKYSDPFSNRPSSVLINSLN